MIQVCDDFFKNPYDVRKVGLKQDYYQFWNYPGFRSHEVPEWIVNSVQSNVREIVKDPTLDISDGPIFHFITKEFREGIFHADPHKYISIVYLSLDPSLDSGTEVCDSDQEEMPRKLMKGEYVRKIQGDHHKDPSNLIKRFKYDRMIKKVNSYYKPIIKLPNKFNRGVIFPAGYFHRAQKSFGTSIENARLTMVTFFK